MEENQSLSKKFFKTIANKYIIVFLVFAIWMIFFDTNSILVHKKLDDEISEINHKIGYYQEKYQKDSIEYYQLRSSREAREKYARENYFMRKKDEDIFIIVHKNDSLTFH